jgi:flagellar basal-body rod protein FlgG
MFRALSTIATGLEGQQTNMDIIANNLANVNTTGFKRRQAQFESLLYQNQIQPGAKSTNSTLYPSGLDLGAGVRIASTKKIQSQGNLTETKNPLDMAINGNGYFQVRLPDGQTAYTRDGSFQVDRNGQLVSADGYTVVPNITIPNGATSVTVGTDGTVSVTLPGSNLAQQVGQIQFAGFINPQGLQPTGNNLFLRTNSSGAPQVSPPQTNGLGSLRQGFLEESNVNIVDSMVKLISSQRAYQLGTEAARDADNEMNYLAQMGA